MLLSVLYAISFCYVFFFSALKNYNQPTLQEMSASILYFPQRKMFEELLSKPTVHIVGGKKM